MAAVDYAIVGAGPAGLQLSYLLKRAGLEHVVLERAPMPGSFFAKYPRQRKLISINKVYTGLTDPEVNMRWDWNSLLADTGPIFRDFSEEYFADADALVSYLQAFAAEHELPIRYGFSAAAIERVSAGFEVTASDGTQVSCRRLVFATGVSKPWYPDIEGIEHCDCYTQASNRPEDFRNQRVLFVGKGNSAFESANNLISHAASIHVASPNPIKMAWRTHFVGHLRAVNNNLLDTYQLKSQNAVLDASIERVERIDNELEVTFAYTHANGEVEKLRYDRVILCTGFRFDVEPFSPSCQPELTECRRLPLMTDEWESTNIKGLFFAGTLTQQRDYKRYMSAFIHGFRYNARALVRFFEQRYHDTPWPRRSVAQSTIPLRDVLLERMNRSSALWQQPGFLSDVVLLNTSNQSSSYLEELPVDYVKRATRGWALMLTLEYGPTVDDPFHVERVHRKNARDASDSKFLHPIVRLLEDGAVVSEHHVIEDLASEWREAEHIEPLHHFVQAVLERLAGADTRPTEPVFSGVVPSQNTKAS